MASSAVEPLDTRPALRRVLGNTGLLLGGRTVNAVLGLAYLALAGRALGPVQFGVLVLIHAFAQFLSDVVKFQSWQTVIHYGAGPFAERRVPDFQQVLRFVIFLDLASSLVAVALGVGGALLFAHALGWEGRAEAAALYMVSSAFMAAGAPLGLLRLFDRFDVMAKQTALVSLVRLLGTGAAYLLDAPLEVYLAAWAAGTLAGFAYLIFAAGSELSRRRLWQGFAWRGPLTAGMPGAWRFAFATNFSATVEVAFTHVITLAVGALVGPAQAALWRIGRQVADAMAKPARLLVPALYPELARIREASGHGPMARLARQVGLVAGGAGAFLMLVTLLAGGPLLTLLMGPSFAPAATLMTWQVAAAVVGIVALPLEPMLVSIGRPGEVLRVRLAVCALYLILLIPIVQRFGAVGAAVLLLAASAALALGMLWRLARSLPSASPSARTPAGAEP